MAGSKKDAERGKKEEMFWADQVAEEVIKEHKKGTYACASGISPSGIIHFGNFREVITVDFIVRALKDRGRKTKFIYSWDDYDRFRKTPSNIPKEFDKYIGVAYCFIPDPFKCHKSYAEHFESIFESSLLKVGIKPVFIRQNEMYRQCIYAEEIRHAVKNRDKIADILNKYRKAPLQENWLPLEVFCEKCHSDFTEITEYRDYSVSYVCKCGHKDTIDFRKKGIVKLPWRVDWPMRWAYEDISFEPGGKEHSTPGGSRTTGKEIIEEVWKKKAPVYKRYDYIILKGVGGKMSGSLGNVITVDEVLEVYEPEIVRYLFAGTRPGSEFFVSFDTDVIKVYEDFDSCERTYFGKNKAKSEKEEAQQKRVYEMSCIKLPAKMPFQPSFRHLTSLLQIYSYDVSRLREHFKEEIKDKADLKRLEARAGCAWNWIRKYAPDEFKFTVQSTVPKGLNLNEKQKKALHLAAKALKEKKLDEVSLHEEFYSICKELQLPAQDFFKAAYLVLLAKEKGPRLAHFILALGKEKAISMFEKV